MKLKQPYCFNNLKILFLFRGDGAVNKDLIELQRSWYEKLKEEGFKDIESMDETGSMDLLLLEQPSSSVTYKFNEHTAEYFQLATHWLSHFQFENTRHELIWKMHSDGLSYREIVREIEKLNWPKPRSLFFVQHIVRTIRTEMLNHSLVRK